MKMGEDDPSIEPSSLEYIEDSYLPKIDHNMTPSLDDISEYEFLKCDDLDLNDIYDENGPSHWSEEADLYLRSLTLDQILTIPDDLIDDATEMQAVETEFSPFEESSPPTSTLSRTNRLKNYLRTNKLRFLTRKKMRDVRVTFVDFSKPYLAKISSGDNYKNFLNIGQHSDGSGKLSDSSPGAGSVGSASEAFNELAGLTLEEQEAQRAEWSQELARVEEEIQTLRTVLASKIHHSTELKRKLGITVWKEITDDVSSGIKNVKESNVYQTVESKVDGFKSAVVETPMIKNSRISKGYHKTESVIKTTAEKTSSLFSGFTTKLSQMKNSESFKSFEDRVGGAYESVKTKVSTSRSGSVQNFNDFASSTNTTAPTTPTIHEEKPIA